MLDHLLTVCVLGSHGLAMHRFVRALRDRRLPEPIDFTVLSAILYYDLGLVAEWLTGEIAPSQALRGEAAVSFQNSTLEILP